VTSDKKKQVVSLKLGTRHLSLVTCHCFFRHSSLVTVCLVTVCHLSLVTVFALAQSQTTGRIAGTVKDQNGAVIVSAAATVTSLATAEQRKVSTDNAGNYDVSLLPPGTYRVSVTANGFKKTDVESVEWS
jgi:hypothetical protein